MKNTQTEIIILTAAVIQRINEICSEEHELSVHLLEAIERMKDETEKAKATKASQ